MSLTIGPGPFGHAPAARFNIELPPMEGMLFLEPSPRRIRGLAAGETVIDSRRVQMLYEHGRLPIYLFPRDDVRTEMLEPSERRTSSENKGEARWWHLRTGKGLIEHAAWEYASPPSEAAALSGLIGFEWSAMDEWCEEDEPAIVHPRDPYHRLDVLDTSRRVRVVLDGETLAETERGKVLFETGLPPRWYIPREDVREELLVDSDHRTGCAYKGFASYHSVRVGDRIEEDLVWYYADPLREVEPIRDHLAFYNERADIEVDGVDQGRPMTPFHPDWRPPKPEAHEGKAKYGG
jgi:uncharacterized protein (DUF427 family)